MKAFLIILVLLGVINQTSTFSYKKKSRNETTEKVSSATPMEGRRQRSGYVFDNMPNGLNYYQELDVESSDRFILDLAILLAWDPADRWYRDGIPRFVRTERENCIFISIGKARFMSSKACCKMIDEYASKGREINIIQVKGRRGHYYDLAWFTRLDDTKKLSHLNLAPVMYGSADTKSEKSEACFIRGSRDTSYYGYGHVQWNNKLKTKFYESQDQCDVIVIKGFQSSWWQRKELQLFHLSTNLLQRKTCEEKLNKKLTDFQHCLTTTNVEPFDPEYSCTIWTGLPVYCAGKFVGFITDPDNGDGKRCNNIDRTFIFEGIENLHNLKCHATETCPRKAQGGNQQNITTVKDTTPFDPYGEGIYQTAKSGEYVIPGEAYVADDNKEDVGDGLAIDQNQDDYKAFETGSEEQGIQIYKDKDDDKTKVKAPNVNEYDEHAHRNLTEDDSGYPMIKPVDDKTFYDLPTEPENGTTDLHYMVPEILANKDYYKNDPAAVDIKPWLDFPDDAIALADATKDYGDTPTGGPFKTIAEEQLYLFAYQNYDSTTPELEKPIDKNTNTVELDTPTPKIQVPSRWNLRKQRLSTTPGIPPTKGKINRYREEPTMNSMWNDGLNVFIPSYGRYKKQMAKQPIDQYNYIVQPYDDFAALGPEPTGRRSLSKGENNLLTQKLKQEISKHMENPDSELPALGPDPDAIKRRVYMEIYNTLTTTPGNRQKTHKEARSEDGYDTVYKVGPDPRHGWLFGAYGEQGPAKSSGSLGVGGYYHVSNYNDNDDVNKHVGQGPFGGLFPSLTGRKVKGPPDSQIKVFSDGMIGEDGLKFPEARPGEWQPWNNIIGPPLNEQYEDKDADFVHDEFVKDYQNPQVALNPSPDETEVSYQRNCVYVTIMVTHGIVFVVIACTCCTIVGTRIHRYRSRVLVEKQLELAKLEEEERKLKEAEEAEEELKKRARAEAKAAGRARRDAKLAREAEEARLAEEGSLKEKND